MPEGVPFSMQFLITRENNSDSGNRFFRQKQSTKRPSSYKGYQIKKDGHHRINPAATADDYHVIDQCKLS